MYAPDFQTRLIAPAVASNEISTKLVTVCELLTSAPGE